MSWLRLIRTCLLVSTALSFVDNFGQTLSFRLKGDSAFEARNYELAASLYERQYQRSHSSEDAYNAACAFSLSNDIGKARIYLDQGLDHNISLSLDEILSDPDLDALRKSGDFQRILNKHYPARELRFATAQEVSWKDLAEYVDLKVRNGDRMLTIHNKTVYWEKSPEGYVYNLAEESKFRGDYPEFSINFDHCEFFMSWIWGWLSEPSRTPALNHLDFSDCNFHGAFILGKNAINKPLRLDATPGFKRCNFNFVQVSLDIANGTQGWPGVVFKGCNFGRTGFISISSPNALDVHFNNNRFSHDSSFLAFEGRNLGVLELGENSMANGDVQIIASSVDRLSFDSDTLANIAILNTTVNTEFNLTGTSIGGKVLVRQSLFPDSPNSNVEWHSLRHAKLGLFTDWHFNPKASSLSWRNPEFEGTPLHVSPNFVTGESESDFVNEKQFKDLVALYFQFLGIYRQRGDLEAYNECFIAMKELQTKRLAYLYRSHPSFESYFRLKLAQLLKFYVRYGTDPARAIVVSIYLILSFGVFFFFFPSDWDTTSKSRLLQNFRDFIQKNDKGYVKPIFAFVWGAGLSFANAITLSLNAFVTLGFGNIPTHGLARYVCILEGFLGWFLLSLFTVALINQVI